MHISPLGDKALLIELGGGIDEETLARVTRVVRALDDAQMGGVTDIVVGYTSVAVHYEPVRVIRDMQSASEATSPAKAAYGYTSASALVLAAIEAALREATGRDAVGNAGDGATQHRIVEIPVIYGGDDGPDLAALAALHAMLPDDVVAIHAGATYTVHMMGFVPGFPYLGGLDVRLATPRRDTPRTLVPAGSVGIGGAQTGVYPIDSPGGWHIIGRTSLRLFDVARDAARQPPALLHLGDRVRFVDVGRA